MNDAVDVRLAAQLESRLAQVAGFVAHDLLRWAELSDRLDDPLSDLTADARRLLATCRSPRAEHFAADVIELAEYVDASPLALARFFRLLDAAETLAASPVVESGDTGLLTAARDVVGEEMTTIETPPTGAAVAAGALPVWLADVVEHFWRDSPPGDGFPRDLELQILLHHPVAVLEVPDLRLSSVRPLLGVDANSELALLPNRPLHACLLAFGGVGVIVVDAHDGADERRVNLAHEMGHFLTDYLIHRDRLAAHDPELLEVMDGLRPATTAESLGAMIANVPLGLRAHLVERDLAGGYTARSAERSEDRAELVAWELLAPRQVVLARAPHRTTDELATMLRAGFGLPDGVATAYGRFLARAAGRRGDNWLDGLDP